MGDNIEILKRETQEEVWRLQMIDYITPHTYQHLDYLKAELKKAEEKATQTK